ncbi:MAG: alanine racemase [Parvibaculum sp.]|uniref:alanine racemase n=1 Tax=Parvibaculum sp. TaxID=2024848 RepID=UPI0034A0346A
MRAEATEAELAAAGGLLTVDLDAVAANWRAVRAAAPGAEAAAVVKADAYGLGMAAVARRLAGEGCGSFFVADANEGATLRTLLPGIAIYVLNGLFPGTGALYRKAGLTPCLASMAELAEWRDEARCAGETLPAVLHFDTGINRLGMSAQDAAAIAEDGALSDGVDVRLIMSHLACADDAASPKNGEQLGRFRALLEALGPRFPGARASLANSPGVFLGPDYHFDLVRPGVGLYGGNPLSGRANPFRPAVTVEARVIALRTLTAGETVGYGAAWAAKGPARIAVLSAGYADGYFRALGRASAPESGAGSQEKGGQAHIAGYTVPVAGRVSMDMLALDVSAVPEGLIRRGDMAELIGPTISVDDVGLRAGTIGYEILTSLGRRYIRRYVSKAHGTRDEPGGQV